jgi:20S proteasome alpha/beta subunit
MTTLVGIRTSSGLDSIVLASDNQETNDAENSRKQVQKLFYGSDWAIGCYGGSPEDKLLTRFMGLLKGDRRYRSSKEKADEIISRAATSEIFQEVIDLNREVEKRDRHDECKYGFIFAARNPKFGLWEIGSHGNLFEPPDDNEFDYICLGSGAEKAKQYIAGTLKEGSIEGREFERSSIRTGIAAILAKRAIQAAEEDFQTGLGYDLIVLPQDRKKEVEWLGKEIQEKVREADKAQEEDMRKRYDKWEGDVFTKE